MHESGVLRSNQGQQRVIGGSGVNTQHKQGGADCKRVTRLVSICADGTTLPPLIILKAKHLMSA